jgi:ATP-dependent protease ClpP protease subunit
MTLTPLEALDPVDREAAAREVARIEGIVVEMLAQDVRRNVETVRHDLHRYRTFRAREALAYGLVDAIRD